jgi:hypothetical protein
MRIANDALEGSGDDHADGLFVVPGVGIQAGGSRERRVKEMQYCESGVVIGRRQAEEGEVDLVPPVEVNAFDVSGNRGETCQGVDASERWLDALPSLERPSTPWRDGERGPLAVEGREEVGHDDLLMRGPQAAVVAGSVF